MKGIDINEIVEFVSAADKAEENPTKFLLGNISNKDKMKLFADAMDKEGKIDISKLQDKTLNIVKSSLKRIKNLGGIDYDMITDEAIDKIPFNVLVELAGEILKINFLSIEERKN